MREKQGEKEKKRTRYHDYSLVVIIIFLLCFGLVMLYSTSSYNAQLKFNDSTYYLRKQLEAVILGLFGMIVVSHIPYHFWQRISVLVFVVSVVLCWLVFSPLGIERNGSRRWIGYHNFSFQPSELAKIGVIIFMAALICKMQKQMGSLKKLAQMLVPFLFVIAPVAISNLSTAIIMVGILFMMVFVASPKTSRLIVLALVGVAALSVFLLIESYRLERVQVWLHPEEYEKGYQTLQGLYAIGSGGLFGKGLGESMQKLGFVPEAQNDMIFSIICEELGIFGAVCVILLFLMMIWRFMVIANNASDLFGSLVVTGIMAHISLQVVLNIAVVTNTIPNTGVTLPFISYGGTSVSILLSEMGLALAVSRGIKL